MNKLVSSKHLQSVSDLTLTAPIKQGFIDAFETVTYETRLAKLLEALFKIRSTAREYSEIKPFADTAERIQSLLDYRLAILDTKPRRLMLTATFDKPFEPYMRLIWDPLGPLLDVIFCNCEGYVTATEHSFPDYLAWVRSSQIDTNFFYSANGYSVGDVEYLLKVDRLERERLAAPGPNALAAADPSLMVQVTSPEHDAKLVRRQAKDESDLLGLEALVSLYRLTDFYPPDQPNGDGRLLRRATQQLLRGWGCGLGGKEELIREQLGWFWHGIDKEQYCLAESGKDPPVQTEAEKAKAKLRAEAERLKEEQRRAAQERLTYAPGDIQGGILAGYGTTEKPVRLGALLLMRILDAAKARKFIDDLPIQAEHPDSQAPAEEPFLNLAFTCRGLANIGVAGSELARFPQEFLEGMEERAGLLGDVRESHPRNWTLPDRNWPEACRKGAPALPVEMSEIDLVIQLRSTAEYDGEDIVKDRKHPLYKTVQQLGGEPDNSGVQLLAVQPMRRADRDLNKFGREHFGFMDGFSQPKPVDATPDLEKDEVGRGEVLLGYSNDRSDPPQPPSEILDNGTFLVVRKLRQHVAALRAFVETAAQKEGISQKLLYAKMMGRTRDGDPLRKATDENRNVFSYGKDAEGRQCPFQSHIRRTNPREPGDGGSRRPTPRILRRGLSYGAGLADDAKVDDGVERGVVFMAYNASIAEQFEVVQRWVNGGNSTKVASWQNDPLMGVPADNGPRVFRFTYDPESDAGTEDDPQNPANSGARRIIEVVLPQAFVELKWGMYLFVPSIKAIDAIVKRPQDPLQVAMQAEADEAERGEEIVARLLSQAGEGPEGRRAAAAAWKICLEDFSAKDPAEKAEAPAIWAAIRRRHGGALRVPYGIVERGGSPEEVVLVASKDLVMRSFRDPESNYSMRGQMVRMKESFGEIFLGMDKGPDYDVKSMANGPILNIQEKDAFAVARREANKYLAGVCVIAAPQFSGNPSEIDLRREFITSVLALICHHYFGIPDNPHPAHSKFVDPLGWGWKPAGERHPRCPGDFMATSRYCFYPDPVPRVQAYGQAQGRALRAAVGNYLDAMRGAGKTLPGELSEEISNLRWPPSGDLAYPTNDELARTIIGVMTGFLPPADGCMRWALYEWIQEKTLWRVQQDLLSHPSADAYQRADKALRPWLERAMQKRPAPDLLWRTATRGHRLGGMDIAQGERIFISIVSALAEDAAAGITDVYPVFGGNREPKDGASPPMHACPAYKAAMGTMLGMLSALLESGRIETLPAPLLVKLGLDGAEVQAEIPAVRAAIAAAAAAVPPAP